MTWRLVAPQAWGAGCDSTWLPRRNGAQWRRVFDGEASSGRMFLDRRTLSMPWKDLALAATQMAHCAFFYRVQLRASEEAARCCPRSDRHLTALELAVPYDVPTRTEPSGPWCVRALMDNRAFTLAEHLSADAAEVDAAIRRCGDPMLACRPRERGRPGDRRPIRPARRPRTRDAGATSSSSTSRTVDRLRSNCRTTTGWPQSRPAWPAPGSPTAAACAGPSRWAPGLDLRGRRVRRDGLDRSLTRQVDLRVVNTSWSSPRVTRNRTSSGLRHC